MSTVDAALRDKLIDAYKAEILINVAEGTIPADKIGTFSDLHNYVDANMYGFDEYPDDWDEDFIPTLNEVQDAIDTWIWNGGLYS